MFVTIQGKPIPVEWQIEAIAHICRYYKIDTKSGCSLQVLKNRFRQNEWRPKRHKYFGRTSRPTSVCIRNLPLSFHQLHVVTLINIVSDFETSSPNFYVDMYRDSQNNSTGQCLVRFINSKYVQSFFNDLKGLSALDKNIIVTIDEDNLLSREKDLRNPLFIPGKKRSVVLKQYILQQQLYDYTNSKYSDSSMMNNQIKNCYDAPMMNKDNDGITKSNAIFEMPQCEGNENQTSADFVSDGPMTKIQGKRVPVKMVYGAIAHICKEFKIEIKHGTISDMKKEFKQKVVGPTAMADLHSPPDLWGTDTRSMLVTNLPISFTQFHVVILIHLLSEFDIKNMNFFIDMYQDAQNRYLGDCLIRFIKARFLGQVFIDMLALRNLNSYITLRIDYDCAITAAKDYVNPLFNPMKKWNKMLRYYILNQVFDYSNCNTFLTGDTVKQTSNNNNNAVELEHDDDLIEMIEKRDDGKKDKDNVEIDIKYKDNINEDKESDSKDDAECIKKNKSASIDKASIQIQKSVPAIEKLDDNTQKTHGRNKDLTAKTDVYEDKTNEIEENNPGKASECGAMFYEDKTGDTDTINAEKAESQVQYKVTASQSIDDRTIVSIITTGKAKDTKKRRCILALISNVQRKLQFDMHMVTENNKSTGEYLLRFRTAEDAIKIYNSLKGAKIKKKDTTVSLFSSEKVRFPETAENTSYPDKSKKKLTNSGFNANAVTQKKQPAERKLISGGNASACSRKEQPPEVLPTRDTVEQTSDINNAVELENDDDLIKMIEKHDDDIKEKNNAEKASECGTMFYEDKTGDTDSINAEQAKSQVQYKVAASKPTDDRTIVSVTTFFDAADRSKRMFILQIVKRNLQFDIHRVIEENKSNGEYLLRFRTAKDALNAFSRLRGSKKKNKVIKVSLFSSEKVSFPESAENTSYPPECDYAALNALFNGSAVTQKKQPAGGGKLISGVNASAVSRTNSYYDFTLTKMPPEERSYDTYGLNEEFLKKHNINVPLRATVVVKNLNSEVDENKLHEVFSLAGVIRRLTNINSDTEGHFAKIEFDHPLEAVQAISLFHHQELYKQKITVEMDTVWEERPLPNGLCSVGRGLGENCAPLRDVRNAIQLNEAKEALVESGKFTKHSATDRTMPFMYSYIQNNSDKNSSDSTSNDDSNASKDQNSNDDIFDGTSIEELNNALTSQGLIPEGANCKDLDDLLNILKSNPPETQTEQINVSSEDLDQNNEDIMETAPPNQGENNTRLNLDPNMPYTTNRPLNPNVMGRFIPNQRMRMLPPFFPPNMALNFRFHPFMRGPHPFNFHPNMPNMMHNVPHMNQTPVFRPRIMNEIQRAAMLYGDHPPPKRNRDLNVIQHPLLNAQNTNQQVQETPPKQSSKGMKKRYFGRDIPEDCDPLRPGNQSSDAYTNELSEDVIYLGSPKRQKQQDRGDNSNKLQLESPKDGNPGNGSGGAQSKTDTLIFKNLPSCVPAEALVSKLSEVGELLFCNLTGRGRAVVRFKSPADAERCTKLFNDSKVQGQVISVTPV